ncbi:NAD(P)/FAD-dependent oxidoreductase [Afifella sp. H1R]|uniref:FAD/NAD(P)-dependent oxidoreductase n=1 Tax=Afifella sp. H1R TaxID=2908841 RepID=UPI001F2768B8|nr:FAD/NAD(P)-binding oxidoreductase [Afifella sp. H1R]MCF1502384.1 NAD(P)/FAD-dependent oxidoreductase [Afifella sp. H1R]
MSSSRVVVIGAGPAGTRAAETLVAAGLRPVVVDEAPRSGGQIYRRQPQGFSRPLKKLYGFEADKAARLHETFDRLQDKVDYRPGTMVWGTEGRNLHLADRDGRQDVVGFDALILATGAVDRIVPFEGWTMPGVYTLGGAQIALKYQACLIGRNVALVGSGPLLYLVAYQYRRAGGKLAGIFDTTPLSRELAGLPRMAANPANTAKGLYYFAWLAAHGVPMLHGVAPVRAEGEGCVARLVLRDRKGRERTFACDAVATGYHVQSETQLADLLGCDFDFDARAGQWLPRQDEMGRSSVDGVYLAGDGASVRGADTAEATGTLAALACLEDQGLPRDAAVRDQALRAMRRGSAFASALRDAFPFPEHLYENLADETILCRCEEVSVGTFRATLRDKGADEVNRAKAFCRVGMGRCQGRMCGASAARVAAQTLGVELASVGRLRGQAPVKPLPAAIQTEAGE